MDDDYILEHGGTEEHIARYAEQNGANMTEQEADEYYKQIVTQEQEASYIYMKTIKPQNSQLNNQIKDLKTKQDISEKEIILNCSLLGESICEELLKLGLYWEVKNSIREFDEEYWAFRVKRLFDKNAINVSITKLMTRAAYHGYKNKFKYLDLWYKVLESQK